MGDPLLPLQAWLYETLSDGSPAIGAPVYDQVPRDAGFPRVTFGPGQSLPGEDDGQCGATFELFQQLDVWSSAVGTVEVKEIAGRARDLIHGAAPDLAGFTVVLLEVRGISYSRDPDGLTSRARLDLRALIDAA